MRLAELGWLHNKIRKYTDQRSLDRSFGLVGQVCSWELGWRSPQDALHVLRTSCDVILRRVPFP